jgi:tetratricopeptide (TPR) repeat protein
MTVERPPLPDSYEGILKRAQDARNAGDTDQAFTLYRRLIDRLGRLSDRIRARRPDLMDLNLQARLDLAEVLRLEARYAEAIEVMKPLLDTHRERADEWRRSLALLNIAKGEVESGLEDLRSQAEEKPDDIWRWITLGSETRIEGRFAESESALDRAVEVATEDDPNSLAIAHYQRFRLFKEMGQLDRAIASWEKAIAADPEAITRISEVYTMLTDAGRYSEARRYVARDPNELQAGFQRGLIASLTGNLAQAKEEWQTVAAANPTDFDYGYESWVESALRLGDPDPVLERIQELLMRFGIPRLLILGGIAWAMKGNAGVASSYFQHAIDVLRHNRPPKQKLDSADWHLMDSLVDDEQVKAGLKSYFAVLETLWGATPPDMEGGEGPIVPPLRT